MNIKILHISGDAHGGAGIAAKRISDAIGKHTPFKSSLVSPENLNDFFTCSQYAAIRHKIEILKDRIPRRLFGLRDKLPRSSGWGSVLSADKINRHPADIIHLHWINNAFLSLEEIVKINKPIVWSLHDIWPFVASEHIFSSSQAFEDPPRIKYQSYQSLYDKWIYKRKEHLANKNITFVAPSKWTKTAFNNSDLFHDFCVEIIPNPLDTSIFRPLNKLEVRKKWNLPSNKKLILFGSVNPGAQKNKGLDLVLEAIKKLSSKDFEFVIFGKKNGLNIDLGDVKTHFVGHISNEFKLNEIYSSCDVMVVPSRLETFGQTASEAISAGCPVVCFNTSGLRDIVLNSYNGLLTTPYCSNELSENIDKVISNNHLRLTLSLHGRQYAVSNFDSRSIAQQLKVFYEDIVL